MARQSKKAQPAKASQTDGDGEGSSGASATAAPSRAVKSKADAIRAALSAGFDGPQEGTAFIRKEFGIDIAPQHFSAVKSHLKKREASGEGPRRRGRPKGSKARRVEGFVAPPRSPLPVGGDLIDALEKIKPLIAQYGADKVKRIVDLLG